jgi:sulfate adenylyltransferase subunit 1
MQEKLLAGFLKKGDKIKGLPSGFSSKIKSIEIFGKEVEEAYAPMSVIIHLNDNLDISRGDVIVNENNLPETAREFEAVLCWMDNVPLLSGKKYFLQHNSNLVRCIIKEIIHKTDVNSFEEITDNTGINLNDICKVKIKSAQPISFDSYKKNKANGSFILIDESSNITAGAGMIS